MQIKSACNMKLIIVWVSDGRAHSHWLYMLQGQTLRQHLKQSSSTGFQKSRFFCLIMKQNHLRINSSTRSNNHLRSIDLFKSMIIENYRSKVCDVRSPPPSQSVSQSEIVRMQSECSQDGVKM